MAENLHAQIFLSFAMNGKVKLYSFFDNFLIFLIFYDFFMIFYDFYGFLCFFMSFYNFFNDFL